MSFYYKPLGDFYYVSVRMGDHKEKYIVCETCDFGSQSIVYARKYHVSIEKRWFGAFGDRVGIVIDGNNVTRGGKDRCGAIWLDLSSNRSCLDGSRLARNCFRPQLARNAR